MSKPGKKSVAKAVPATPTLNEDVPPGLRKTRKPSSPLMKAVGGSGFESWDYGLFYRTVQTVYYAKGEGETDEDAKAHILGTAGLGIEAFKPTDPVEAMFAAQAVAMHLASMECFRRAIIPQQSSDVASRLRRDGANAARGMADMVDALARYRGKGTQQVIRVEKMLVGDGGRAAVGHFHGASQALGEGAAPIALPEVESVKAGGGEGV